MTRPIKPEFPLKLNGVDLDADTVSPIAQALWNTGDKGLTMARQALTSGASSQQLASSYENALGGTLGRNPGDAIKLENLLNARKYEVALAFVKRDDHTNPTAQNAIQQALHGRTAVGGPTKTGVIAREYLAAQMEKPNDLSRKTRTSINLQAYRT